MDIWQILIITLGLLIAVSIVTTGIVVILFFKGVFDTGKEMFKNE